MCLRFILFFILLSVGLQSCVSKKEIVYLRDYQNNTVSKKLENYEPVIQKDDILYLQIQTNDPLISNSFNIGFSGEQSGSANLRVSPEPFTYLVSADGTIDLPTIGKVKVIGLTKTECKLLLEEKLSFYVKNPTINIRTLNFKVSVLGEVNRPGVITINSDRMTIFDALAGAGDLTIFGKRKNILLVREVNGVQTTYTIDLTNSEFINSPAYYMQNNDIVYVEPRASKRDSTALGSNVTVGISIISFLMTAIVLLSK